MKIQDITDMLNTDMENKGFKSKIISISHLPKIKKAIEENLKSSKIKNEVYQQYKNSFDNMLTQDIHWARSIIVVAAPTPKLEVIFTIDGNKQAVIIPPTYEHSVDKIVTKIIESVFIPNGYRICEASLPQKLVAAHSGLARYGKNNITYVDGMGSYQRILTFYTDLPCNNDYWQEPQVLDECTKCRTCTKLCPTNAIDPDRFQLHSEKCLTYHNESPNDFPSWIEDSWHHCLIGCMKCQQYCPANKDIRFWKEKYLEFSEAESKLLLSGMRKDELPPSLLEKFENLDMMEYPKSFARNLKSVLV